MQLTRHHAHQFAKRRARGSLNSARCSGQLAVQLTATGRQGQKVHQLAWWLRQHARSVQRLDLRLSENISDSPDDRWPEEEVQAVTSALQQAASTGSLVLQHFSLSGQSVPCELLAALPASCLTSLECEISRPYSWEPSENSKYISAVKNISHLQQLQQLKICSYWFVELTYQEALTDLTRLEHLTSLQLDGPWFHWKDEQVPLPPNLVQLEVGFILHKGGLESFGKWLQEHANLLTHLSLQSWRWDSKDLAPDTYCDDWSRALQHAASPSGGKLQLQHLRAGVELSSQLYRQLGELCQLVSLTCDSDNSAARNAEVLSAICTLTSLRELEIRVGGWDFSTIGDLSASVLQQLSTLTGLTKLDIQGVAPQQLQYLPAGLSELTIMLNDCWKTHTDQRGGFDMGHLASLTKLDILEINHDDVLPPNLISLHTCGCGPDRVGSACFQPLLHLQSLQEMELSGVGSVTSAQLQDLGSLCSLTSLSLQYVMMESTDRALTAEHMAACASLPLKSLTIEYWERPLEGAMPTVIVEGLVPLHGLTELRLEGCIFEHDVAVLRNALLSLTELRTLDICLGTVAKHGSGSFIDCEGTTQSMLAAADTLPHLEECQLLI